ncbi:MAG: hypothetical protein HY296_02655 [Thaumarchaeota archaeon]|nr:hypothetical protein [Nitrososphaerota archaeon]
MIDRIPQFGDDLVTFDSTESMRLYIKKLLNYYQKQVDRYGAASGEMMREVLRRENSAKRQEKRKKADPSPWQKMGSLLVNTTDSLLGKNEINLQLLQEYTFKLRGTQGALEAFEGLERFDLEGSSSLILYLKDGVPGRIVVEHVRPNPPDATASAKPATTVVDSEGKGVQQR